MLFLLHLNPARHTLPTTPTEIDQVVRREFPRFKLFSYFHKNTHNWMLAEWVSKDRGIAIEVMTLGPAPRFWQHEQVDELRQRLNQPQRREDIPKMLDADDKARARLDESQEAERKDLLAKIMRDFHPGRGAGQTLFIPSYLSGTWNARKKQ
jgi:hypothetical protein